MPGRVPFPEPTGETGDPGVLLRRQLAFYRSTVLGRAGALSPTEQRRARVPSGWSPLALVRHLAHMERRWIVWGFLGEAVEDPWGDHASEEPGRWVVPEDVSLPDLAAMMALTAARTEEVLGSTALDEVAATGGRFEADPPTLAAIALHVLAEYARHAGHLDVAVELAGGPTGE